MKRGFFQVGLMLFILFGLVMQVSAQRPNSSALNDLLSAGSQAVTASSILLNETFDDSNAWESYQDDHINQKVGKGVYRMSLTGKVFTWGLNSDTHTDVVIQADTLQNSSNLNNSYGIICRAATNGDGYYFQISGDGYYNIMKSDGDDITQLVEWAQSEVIVQGQNRNQMVAVCVGDYLALYANDQLLAEANDDTFTEGFAGFTVGAFDENEDVDISFDNTVIWEAIGGRGGTGGTSGLPQTLSRFDQESERVIAELEDEGVIPSGSVFVFGEDYAFFTGRGNFFTPLGRRSPRQDIVMAGELTFTVGDESEFEACILTSRIDTDSNGSATTYVDVGFTNSGGIFINDVFSTSQDSNFTSGDRNYDLDDSHHVLLIMVEDKASVYIDGELAIAEFEVDVRSGSYGISLIGKGANAKCEGRNIWVYEVQS